MEIRRCCVLNMPNNSSQLLQFLKDGILNFPFLRCGEHVNKVELLRKMFEVLHKLFNKYLKGQIKVEKILLLGQLVYVQAQKGKFCVSAFDFHRILFAKYKTVLLSPSLSLTWHVLITYLPIFIYHWSLVNAILQWKDLIFAKMGFLFLCILSTLEWMQIFSFSFFPIRFCNTQHISGLMLAHFIHSN